jgi:hypothetical protein
LVVAAAPTQSTRWAGPLTGTATLKRLTATGRPLISYVQHGGATPNARKETSADRRAYTDGSGRFQAFVVSETNGTWRTAIRVPGSGALNAGGHAVVNSVSCASAGNCAAGGDYTDGSGHLQGFAVGERNGTWGKAIRVPGSGALNAGGFASVGSVSCASAGNCAAGGFYTDGRSWSARPSDGSCVRAAFNVLLVR